MNLHMLTLAGPNGEVRLLVDGTDEQVAAASEGIRKASESAISEDDLVSRGIEAAISAGLTVGDVFRRNSSGPTLDGLAAGILLLARQRDPVTAWAALLEMLQLASLEQTGALATEPEYTAQREYLRSLLYALDESAEGALRDLAETVGDPFAYLLAGRLPARRRAL